LTSALDAGEWSTSRRGRFTHRERASGTHWIRGWVGPRAILDAVVKNITRNFPIYTVFLGVFYSENKKYAMNSTGRRKRLRKKFK
jgi:hypothetical protein